MAKVRTLSGSGEAIAKLFSNVSTYISENKLSENEAYEILADYVDSPGFKSRYKAGQELSYDGWGEYSKGKDVEELWKLTIKIPPKVSYPLLAALPEESGLSGLPPEVLQSLDPYQLSTLFDRDDICLSAYRKEIFFNPERPGMSDYDVYYLQAAAVSRHVDFIHAEFASLLPNLNAIDQTDTNWKFKDENDEKKLKILRDLGSWAGSLSWVYYAAIHDFLFAVPVRGFRSAYEDAEWPKKKLNHLIEEGKKNKKSYNIQLQVIDLKLYRLAVNAVPWDNNKEKYKPHSPKGELNFLHDAIIEGDTWATFMGFSERWRSQKNAKTLEVFLPSIYSFDEDENTEEKIAVNEEISSLTTNNIYDDTIRNINNSLNKTKILAYIIIVLLTWVILFHK